jgi:hypothetical protein
MKTSDGIIKEMDRLLDEYSKQVEAARVAGLVTPKTAKTYLLHPTNFIRWCKGEFEPGERNRK